jgi:uncharacterized protein YtpQ (UPF0354 family)
LRHLILALCLFAAPAWADIPKPETLDQTLALMLPRVVEAFPEARIDWTARNIDLGDGGSVLNPDNIHAVLRTIEDGAEREAELDRFIATMVTALQDVPADDGLPLDRVYTVVRHESWATLAGSEDLLWEPFVGDMIRVFAIDYPDRVSYVTQTLLAEEDANLEDLRWAAQQNMIAKGQNAQFQSDGTIIFAVLDGFYESSLIMDERLLADIALQLQSDLVIAVPARDLFVFAPSTDAAGLARLREILTDVSANAPHQLSEHLYLWSGGTLSEYTP